VSNAVLHKTPETLLPILRCLGCLGSCAIGANFTSVGRVVLLWRKTASGRDLTMRVPKSKGQGRRAAEPTWRADQKPMAPGRPERGVKASSVN